MVGAGVIAVIVVLVVATAADHAPDGGRSVGTVSAAAVQGGGARGFRKSQINPAVVLAAQMAATRSLEERDHGQNPQLVLWPEDVVSLDTPLSQSPEEAVLSNLARSLHSTLVVGVTETVSNTAFRNEVVAWGPDGTLVSRYEKVHRVPFGEYVPYRSFFSHLANLSAVPLDAIPGTGTGLLPTPAAPLGAMISYEVFYADRGRSSVRAGAQLLIVPTNTSSYSTAQVPTQEIAASEVQAVQQGRDLLQAAPTGYSAAITHRGVLLDRSVLGARQVVTVTLDRRDGATLYVRFGDLPVLLLAGAALIAGWMVAGRRGRVRANDQIAEQRSGVRGLTGGPGGRHRGLLPVGRFESIWSPGEGADDRSGHHGGHGRLPGGRGMAGEHRSGGGWSEPVGTAMGTDARSIQIDEGIVGGGGVRPYDGVELVEDRPVQHYIGRRQVSIGGAAVGAEDGWVVEDEDPGGRAMTMEPPEGGGQVAAGLADGGSEGGAGHAWQRLAATHAVGGGIAQLTARQLTDEPERGGTEVVESYEDGHHPSVEAHFLDLRPSRSRLAIGEQVGGASPRAGQVVHHQMELSGHQSGIGAAALAHRASRYRQGCRSGPKTTHPERRRRRPSEWDREAGPGDPAAAIPAVGPTTSHPCDEDQHAAGKGNDRRRRFHTLYLWAHAPPLRCSSAELRLVKSEPQRSARRLCERSRAAGAAACRGVPSSRRVP